MSKKEVKPIKKWDMCATYIVGVVTQFLTIVLWFLPTFKMNYFLGDGPVIKVTLFSYNSQLSLGQNIFSGAFLLLSVLSLIWMIIPLVKGTVMKPRNMIFPAVFNLIYLAIFSIRYTNAISTFLLYDVSYSVTLIAYFLALAFAFGASLSLVICKPRLKRQFEQASNEDNAV